MSQDFYFLLMPGFSAIGFISAIEPLRVANRFRGELYRWHVLSCDGGAVLASNGMSVNADAALEPLKKGATLWVVAGFEPLKCVTAPLVHWLRAWIWKVSPWAVSTPAAWSWPMPACWRAIA
ncbi:hypothetical protein M1B35_25890 [Pseudomonas sp. MAFF 302046]|uniref:AraC family transcriptional regulator n=1 Tax=Pseudomonas morbosilactucae TaxID=2938197 RepID=A0ABT0JPC3_9PSED|nr:hypothetical protein [Pseudomonas morbosilactucae]MCK9817470.1 hypothetical protein [Pseudomonas morbosilactucae]